MQGVAQHWFTVVTQVYESLSWFEFQSEMMQQFSGLEIHHPYEQLATIQQSDSIHHDIDDFVAGKDVEGTLHHDSVVSKGSLSRVRYSNDSRSVYKNGLSGVGQPQPNSSFNSLPSGNRQGELVWWEADTSLDQIASGIKVTHKEHSVMLQNFSTTHSNKCALKLWLFDLHSSTPELGHVFHRDRVARYLSRLDWKGRKKKRICLRWGNRYGPAHKRPEGKTLEARHDQ
ncbi:hypothetical protein E3N88_44541 [Mikania micrantha]|uniref:Uncharacterized protein n=1 Tax=Mikania micrantha TaxID=192012 RepID=A0A5N6LBR1_9ASTR|nr:hypothetical protein E3N88_44541 [Mikania micrantha]